MNKDSIIKALLIVIIVLLIGNILMLGAWGIVSIATGTPLLDFSAPDKGQTEQNPSDLPANANPDTSAVLPQSADMGQEYIDSIIFLGDSTTYHLKSRGVLTGGKDTKQVWSGSGVDENDGSIFPAGTLTLDGRITTTHIYYPKTGEALTIADAVAKEKPQYMVITLGINGVSYVDLENQKTIENFKQCYKALINAIHRSSPDTKIMLQSIFPVTEAYSQSGIGITNEKIDAANTWIMQLAKDTGCKYLDTASVLKNDNGALIALYDNGDGHHLTTDAYKSILQYIRTHGYTE